MMSQAFPGLSIWEHLLQLLTWLSDANVASSVDGLVLMLLLQLALLLELDWWIADKLVVMVSDGQ